MQSSLPIENSIGKIVHHSGDAIKFETTVSLSEECLRALKTSKLEIGDIETGKRKLKLTCEKGSYEHRKSNYTIYCTCYSLFLQ